MAKPNVPGDLAGLLAQADKARGFPAGTMASVMQQETGGNAKYLQDPSTYHYAPNAEGKRIAGHTGKISTAFGPFGILESTGRDPGYGVKPLQSKDLAEQIRFAGDYLAARSKGAGSLQAGLAGYGEGAKYSQQVARRRDGKSPTIPMVPAQMQLAQAAATMPQAPVAEAVQMAALPVQPQVQAQPQTPMQAYVQAGPEELVASAAQAAVPEWDAFQQAMPRAVKASDLNYGQQQAQAPTGQVNFNRFRAFGAKA